MIWARGQSMRPFLRDGARVLLAPVRQDQMIVVGDVILVRLGPPGLGLGGLILHRVIDAPDSTGHLRTRGDGRRSADAAVHRTAVLGRAEAIWIFGRRVAVGGPLARSLSRVWTRVLPYLWPLRARGPG